MKHTAYPYYRVSTKRQGLSGLGLSAQRRAVEEYARQHGLKIGKAYLEIESGRKSKRPVLAKVLRTCERNNGLLLIAKLDRLSRNVAFISSLMESKIQFRAVDIPQADEFLLHILAAVAEREAIATSTRTREALKAAKKKGIVLGYFAKTTLAKRNSLAARRFALRHRLLFYQLEKEGFTTVRSVTKELNRRGVPTYYAGKHKWHIATVHQVMKTIKRNKSITNI